MLELVQSSIASHVNKDNIIMSILYLYTAYVQMSILMQYVDLTRFNKIAT